MGILSRLNPVGQNRTRVQYFMARHGSALPDGIANTMIPMIDGSRPHSLTRMDADIKLSDSFSGAWQAWAARRSAIRSGDTLMRPRA